MRLKKISEDRKAQKEMFTQTEDKSLYSRYTQTRKKDEHSRDTQTNVKTYDDGEAQTIDFIMQKDLSETGDVFSEDKVYDSKDRFAVLLSEITKNISAFKTYKSDASKYSYKKSRKQMNTKYISCDSCFTDHSVNISLNWPKTIFLHQISSYILKST